MTRRLAYVSVLTLLWATTVATAQEPVGEVEVDPVLLNDISPEMELAQERRRDRDRAEDLAILSQIFYEDLLRLYVQAPHTTNDDALDPNLPYDELVQKIFLGARAPAHEVGSPLADYLPGYGVFIQVQAPPPQQPAAADLKHDVTPLSRWEATRLRMRGEAMYDAAACAACHDTQYRAQANLWWSFFDKDRDPHRGLPAMPETARRRPTEEQLIATLANVLSEAGGQLRHIQPDERITLSVQYAAEAQAPSDEEFLRRAYLDLLGQLPTPEDVRSFLADTSAEKRARLIDKLLQGSGGPPQKVQGENELPGRSPAEAAARGAAAPPERVESALDELIKHRLSRLRPIQGSEAPLRGRISVTATRRQIDALAAGALERSDFVKQVVVRSFDPSGVPSPGGRGR